MIWTGVTDGVLSTAEVLGRVGADEDGAVLLFLGVVRDHNDGRPVTGMEYEAYREMAEKVLEEIAVEVEKRWGTDRIVVLHRIGTLEIGEASVAIAVSTPHRAEAYEASRYVIEEIKERLPVWKREHYEDGELRWVPGRRPRVDAEGSGLRAADERTGVSEPTSATRRPSPVGRPSPASSAGGAS